MRTVEEIGPPAYAYFDVMIEPRRAEGIESRSGARNKYTNSNCSRRTPD